MATLYKKEVNAEGNEVLVEVEVPDPKPLEELDIRQHPQYKKLLDENVKNRLKLKEIKTETTTTPSSDDEVEPSAPTTKTPVIPTVDDVLKALEEKQRQEAEEKKKADDDWKTQVDAAMTKHNLPAAMRGVVENSRNPMAQAEALSKSGLNFASGSAGGDDARLNVDDLFAKVDALLGFPKD